MRVYLDSCCFSRPFDDQNSIVVRLETDAKLHVQELIRSNQLELCWSFVLEYENGKNPVDEARAQIGAWRRVATAKCKSKEPIFAKAEQLMKLGLKQMDASHLACAIHLGADFFLTTDKKILNKPITEITVLNPIDFIRRLEHVK